MDALNATNFHKVLSKEVNQRGQIEDRFPFFGACAIFLLEEARRFPHLLRSYRPG
jgi:hypothetical protein